MITLTATDARRSFFELVKSATHGHKVYRIRHLTGSAVLMSEDDYDGLMETLELLSIPGFKGSLQKSVKQVKKGETLSMDEIL